MKKDEALSNLEELQDIIKKLEMTIVSLDNTLANFGSKSRRDLLTVATGKVPDADKYGGNQDGDYIADLYNEHAEGNDHVVDPDKEDHFNYPRSQRDFLKLRMKQRNLQFGVDDIPKDLEQRYRSGLLKDPDEKDIK